MKNSDVETGNPTYDIIAEHIRLAIRQAGVGYFDILAHVLDECAARQTKQRELEAIKEASLRARGITNTLFASGVASLSELFKND